MGKVLLVNINLFLENGIRAVCTSCGHQAEIVKKEDYKKTLGELAGVSGGGRPVAGKELLPTKEMMIFTGMKEGELDAFLAAYKRAGLPVIPRKAVLTPHNMLWTVGHLYAELEEHVLLGIQNNK